MTAPPKTGPVESLAQYHPLIIEGMGGYDPRDPEPIAALLVSQLRDRWQARPPTRPLILVTQGDPIEERGISAITRHVADELGIPRAMVFLDPDIADYHKPNADHHGVILEIPYSALTSLLERERAGVMSTLEQRRLMRPSPRRISSESQRAKPPSKATTGISPCFRKSPKPRAM